MPGAEPGDEGVRARPVLPTCYGVTHLYRVLRLCERFARDPVDWFDAQPLSIQTTLLAFQTIREAEEERERKQRERTGR